MRHKNRPFITLAASLLLLPLLAAAALAGPLGTPPAGWAEQKPTNESVTRYFVLTENKAVAAEMMLVEEQLPQEGFPIDDYMKAVEQNSMPSFQNYSAVETQSAAINGVNYAYHDFLFTNGQKKLKGRIYVTVDGTMGYNFLFDGMEKDFDRLVPRFEEFMRQTVTLGGGNAVIDAGAGDTAAGTTDLGAADTLPAVGNATDTTAPGTPDLPVTTDNGSLPALGGSDSGGLPSLGATASDPGTFSDPGGRFKVKLPEGTTLASTREDGAVYAGPNESAITVRVFADAAAADTAAGEEAGNRQHHGKSDLKAGDVTCTLSLYSEKSPATGKDIAVLVARYQGSGALISIVLPADQYEPSGAWIKAFLSGATVHP